jgi:hypothetical protein
MIRLLLVFLVLAHPARADIDEAATFDISLGGIRAGYVAFHGIGRGGDYAVTARVQSSGLVAILLDLRFEGRATGRLAGGRFRPVRYEEQTKKGREQTAATVRFGSGRPTVVSLVPEGASGAEAPGARAVDPVTALFAALRALPVDSACDARFEMFDGRRHARLRVLDPVREGAELTCTGRYSRLAGPTENRMGLASAFRFSVHYRPTGAGLMSVYQVRIQTPYGVARLNRR